MKNCQLLTCFILVFGVSVTGCTTLQPIDASPDEVQRQLLSGQLVRPGDRVRLVTTDNTVHEFRVTKIDKEQGAVIGKDARVPIADVVALETREVSIGRSALLGAGIGTGVALIIAILIAPALVLSAG